MKAIEILKLAKELISERANWMCGGYAATADGIKVSYESRQAVKFCAAGACMRVCTVLPVDNCPEPNQAFDALRGVNGDLSVTGYNDSSTHEEVLAWFDKAIKYEEAR